MKRGLKHHCLSSIFWKFWILTWFLKNWTIILNKSRPVYQHTAAFPMLLVICFPHQRSLWPRQFGKVRTKQSSPGFFTAGILRFVHVEMDIMNLQEKIIEYSVIQLIPPQSPFWKEDHSVGPISHGSYCENNCWSSITVILEHPHC